MTAAPFSDSEYRRRAAALQVGMTAAGADAMLLTGEHEIRWLTGFLTRFWESPTRPWFVALPAAGDPVAVIPGIGAALMGRTWVRDIRTWDSPDHDDAGLALLAEALREAVPPGGAVGAALGRGAHLRMPLADVDALRAALAPRRFIDATPALNAARAVKSAPEIAAIAAACAAAQAGFDGLAAHARPGASLRDVFAGFQADCLRGGADWVAYLAGGAGPQGYPDVITPASDQRLAAGDVLMLDVGAVRDGYSSDFDRNVAIGHAGDAARRAYAALYAATDAGVAAARPGARACDVFAAMRAALAPHDVGGGGAVGRLGHGLGGQLTEPPSLSAADATPLRAGMVLTIEPSLTLAPGAVMVTEEVIALTDTGATLLTRRAPPELPVL